MANRPYAGESKRAKMKVRKNRGAETKQAMEYEDRASYPDLPDSDNNNPDNNNLMDLMDYHDTTTSLGASAVKSQKSGEEAYPERQREYNVVGGGNTYSDERPFYPSTLPYTRTSRRARITRILPHQLH